MQHLDNFLYPKKNFPVNVETVYLLSLATGIEKPIAS